MMHLFWLVASLALVTVPARGQLPATPKYDQIIKGKLGDGYQVSLKQVHSVCETTPGVKSYSGYITTPPSANSPTVVNSFFWFFESRKDPANAPFTIWLGGGPGFSSVASAVNEIGPCLMNTDSNSTRINPWSFNNESNLLFIDQPVQTGFSYDHIVNGTFNQLVANGPSGVVAAVPLKPGDPIPSSNGTFNVGAFPSQNISSITNSTTSSAVVFWEDVQTWFQAFPQYKPKANMLNLWSESYGGRYAPLFARFFQTQNDLIKQGKISNADVFNFDTVGISNGYIDAISHAKSYLPFAVNNTYDINLINKTVFAALQKNLTAPDGCLAQLDGCQRLAATSDPHGIASNTTVNSICSAAFVSCLAIQSAPIALSQRSMDDIGQSQFIAAPPPYYVGFFQQRWVQEALGAAVNFTNNAPVPLLAFIGTGDLARTGQLEALGQLVDSGVRVTLTYGDLDYQVNWLGGENATATMPWAGRNAWKEAGYANLNVNASYTGGFVRQVGPLSFVRVFQAGHTVAVYQPETMYRIFQRTLAHQDLEDGVIQVEVVDGVTLGTQGPQCVRDVKESPPPQEKQFCYIQFATLTCTPDQLALLASGKGVLKDFVLQE